MVDVKIVLVSVVAVLSVFLQPGIRAQSTIGSSSEDDSCSQLEDELGFQVEENMRLRSLLESDRQKIEDSERCQLRTRERQSVTATFISRLDYRKSHNGITKVEDRIYVLACDPNKIKVYEDLTGFRFIRDIGLSGTNYPRDIVYSNNSKCVYISDYNGNYIWVMTTAGDHRLTKWLTNVTRPNTLSLSNEGHLLILRQGEPFSQLEVYSLNATLIRRIQMPQDIKSPHHVVQTSDGKFIISHQLNNASTGPWVISQLTNDGQLIHRFIPRNKSEKLNYPCHLSLDSNNNRLFVIDNYRVILFDSNVLNWSQVLLSQPHLTGADYLWNLFYDASKKHLFVSQYYGRVSVYEIN